MTKYNREKWLPPHNPENIPQVRTTGIWAVCHKCKKTINNFTEIMYGRIKEMDDTSPINPEFEFTCKKCLNNKKK